MYCCTRQPNADISNVYVEVALGRVEAESEIPHEAYRGACQTLQNTHNLFVLQLARDCLQQLTRDCLQLTRDCHQNAP